METFCDDQDQKGKKYYYRRCPDKEMRIAQRRIFERSEKFKDRYRWRAGVEATMSEYDRRTGVKHLRVRGIKAVRFCATLKALGVNILRAAAVRAAQIVPDQEPTGVHKFINKIHFKASIFSYLYIECP
jgi:hypothetical protein